MKKRKTLKKEEVLGSEWTEEEVLEVLKKDAVTYSKFCELKPKVQEEIKAFIGGRRGMDLLYDNIFRKIFNPEVHRSRVESLLSALLGQKVKIKEILGREGSQLAESGTLVIMDIIVMLEDGSYVDVEMQKEGYLFPSQRSSCYVSDMIMRQYNRKKEEVKEFNYKDMTPVYLFVLIEKPPVVFKGTESYIHKRQVTYSSGIELPELGQVTYIDLDSFAYKADNKEDDLSLWLMLLTKTDVESILRLATIRPEFAKIYQEIAQFRKDPKELVHMLSEALAIMDKNTERYMVDVYRKEAEAALAKAAEAEAQKKQVEAQKKQVEAQKKQVEAEKKQVEAEKKQVEVDKQHETERANRLEAILREHGIKY